MKLKILLAAIYNNSAEIMFEEMGVCALAAFLRQKGYEVMVLCSREQDVDYTKIKQFQPNILGVTVYYYSRQAVYDFCTRMQKEIPGIVTCAGGYLPTYYGTSMMAEAPFMDFLIRGEGEIPLWQLLSHLEKGQGLEDIPGLTYRRQGEICENPDQNLIQDLDSLPPPARDILGHGGLKIASIASSRGCVRNCSFCNTALFWKKWRYRSVPSVLEEIRDLYHGRGVRYFSFNDSSFEDHPPGDEDRIVQLAGGIGDLGLDISYIAGFRAEFRRRATPELMELLSKSGLRQVRIGIEAGNEADRRLYGKYATLEDNDKILEVLQQHRIYPRVGFINFNPYSNFDGLRQNVDFLERHGWAANFFVLLSRLDMLKGTRLYDRVKKDGLMIGEETDFPKSRFVESRLEPLANFLQGYFYLLNMETGMAPGKICNYKNYCRSMVYDFRVRFEASASDRALGRIEAFQKEIDDLLDEVNRRNARWFRRLLDLAEDGWDDQGARQIMAEELSPGYVLATATALADKKNDFSRGVEELGAVYEEWTKTTWETIGNLKI